MARAIWIDTDPGFDDLAAIALAATRPELQLVGLGVVAGNAALRHTLENALRIVTALNLACPVYAGCDRPLLGELQTAERVLGKGALGTLGQPLPLATRGPDPGHAALELIRAARDRPGQLTLVALGPLTNVALALRLEPELPGLLEEIVLMGGSTDRGNHTAAAEFNVYADPEAASIVFESGAKIRMFGLNVTRQVQLREEHVERVRAAPRGRLWADLMGYYLQLRHRSGQRSMPLHDPVTVAYLVAPGLFELRPAHVAIELCGRFSRGATVCDFREKPNALVAVQADGEAVVEMVIAALCGGA